MSSKYDYVSFDANQSQSAEILRGQPWAFINLLPVRVNVYVYTPVKTDLIGSIEPNSKIMAATSASGMPLEKDYEIHVLYQPLGDCGPEFEILRPEFLFDDSRMVRIGDAMHEVKTTTWTQRSHTDIPGIRVHNRLTIPLDIYYHGNKIGAMGGDDGTNSPMSGSPGSVYLTNDNNGFRIGDELGFVFHYNGAKYCVVKINDNYMSDLYIGLINQHFVPTLADMYSYRVDAPNITGLSYFDQTTGYQSKPSSRFI
jgi:hypothetical protein